MSECPSRGWDRYNTQLDQAAAAEAAFYAEHRDRILQVACTLLGTRSSVGLTEVELFEIVELSVVVVREIISRGEPL